MYTTTNSRALGVVFDLSVRFFGEKRIVDTVKSQMVEWLSKNMELEDVFYLYSPFCLDVVTRAAGGVVANFETAGWLFGLPAAIVQTLYVLEVHDMPRYLVFITDRIQDEHAFNKAAVIVRRIGTNFVLVGIGDFYKKQILRVAAQRFDGVHIHVVDPAMLCEELQQSNFWEAR